MTEPLSLAGRRSREQPGPDNADRRDGLDPLWGEDWAWIVYHLPDSRPYLARVLRDAWDWGHRAPRNEPNPVWLEDPDIAGSPQPLPLPPRRSLLMPGLVSIPPTARTVIYYVLGVLNAANVALFVVVGADDKRLLAAQVFLGSLSALFFGVAGSNVRQDPPDYDPRHD